MNWICPPMTSATAGPAPLYGTWTMSVLVICLKSSTARCGVLPMPDEPKLRSPGFARASSMNSFRFVAFTDGCATSTLGPTAIIAIGAMALDGVVRQLVQRRAGGIARRHHGDRVAVRVGARRNLGADRAAGARAVVDDELLAELLGQPRRQQARDDVGAAAGRERHDHAHRPLGPFSGLSMCSRQGCNESQEQQPASSFHRCVPHIVNIQISYSALIKGAPYPARREHRAPEPHRSVDLARPRSTT